MYLPLFFEPRIDLERLRAMLDTCGAWARRNAVRTLDGRMMAALFEASADAEALTLDDYAPGTGALVEVIHSGKNSHPLFNRFEKRFCRPDGDDAGEELWGYNHQFWQPFSGPGYFTARIEGNEFVIDYGRQPPRKPASWPDIIPNSDRVGRFVWVGMVDRMRKVTPHVTIGRVWRHGKAVDEYFTLCREDPTPA